MQFKVFLSLLALGMSLTGAAAAEGRQRGARQPKVAQPQQGGAAATTTAASAGSTGNSNVLQLNPSNVQTGSESDGIVASSSDAGQAASATDPANFINFCTGKLLTNGLQQTSGSCNGIVMGDIPASNKMVSTVITFPQNGQDIAANQAFNFSATSINMKFGAFTNAKATYYAAPQQLDPNSGVVVGHTHFTCQAMTSANVATPLDPTKFAFFKGVNDAGDGQGDVKAVVAGGLPAGIYRVCTMTSSSNHQPVLMPVAQRGPQDDCIRFTVGQGSGTGSNSGGGSGSASAVSSAPAATSPVATAVSTASAVGTSSAAATGTATPKKGGSGSGCDTGKKRRKGGKKAARALQFEA